MIFVLALACRPQPPPGPSSPASWLEDDLTPVAFDVVGQAGNASVVAWVRASNSEGASVLGGEVEVVINGVVSTVTIGPQGYGEVRLEEPGTHIVSAGDSPAEVYVYGGSWPGFGMMTGRPAPMSTSVDAIPAGAGVLTHVANRLWWTGPAGMSHPVLTTEATLDGVESGHLDGDGVLDAVAWTADTVYLLRGRAGGGVFADRRLRSTTHTVAGATLGDASNDGIADLVVAWIGGPGRGRVDVWEGNGLLGFTQTTNRVLTEAPIDIAVGDNQGTGQNVITVSLDDGNWNRLYRGPTYYAPTGPSLELTLPTTGRVHTVPDITGTGAAPVLFAPTYLPDTVRQLVMFDLTPGAAEFTNLRRLGAHVTWHDLDEDGLAELILYDDNGDLVAVRAAPDGTGLATDRLINSGAAGGPVAAFPGTSTILVASTPDWLWFDGESTPDSWFEVRDPEFVSPGISVRDGIFALVEVDGDAVPEVLGLRGGDLATQFRIWDVGTGGVVDIGEVELDPASVGLRDLAVCGTEAFVLLEGALHRVDFSDAAAPVLSESVDVDARKVACGQGPLGPVALLLEDSVSLLDGTLMEVGNAPAAGAEDLWLDEDGAITCDRAACSVARGPVGPAGAIATVESWPDGALLDGIEIHGRGVVTIADVDGNGSSDVVLHREGRVVVHRHTGDGLGLPEIFHTRRPMLGAVGVGDLDGDGHGDLWSVDPENFRLHVTPAVEDVLPADPGDTADTGDTGP